MQSLKGFKQFVEEAEKSQEPQDKEDYFNVLGDELGIKWKNIVKAYAHEPQISTHFELGDTLYKMSPWKTKSMNPQAISFKIMPQDNERTYTKDGKLIKSKYKNTKLYTMKRPDALSVMTKGWTPALQGGAAGSPPIM